MIKNYTVYHNGKPMIAINKGLLKKQDALINRDKILELHSERFDLIDMMREELDKKDIDKDLLYLYDTLYTEIEFDLQRAWKFPINSNYHRFWDRIGCSCPVMDNSERYPYGYYVVSFTCLLHGG